VARPVSSAFPSRPWFVRRVRRVQRTDRVGNSTSYAEEPIGASDGLEAPITYWEARAHHPLCHYHETTGDWRAYRLSDFVTPRELRRRRIYDEWVRPTGQMHLLTVGLDAPLSHTKVFLFYRPSGPEFDERDCLALDVLRPYLTMRYETARSHGRALDEQRLCAALTPREREILDLVAEGETNGQIAEQLWISGGTVRRHLENTFAKLDVHTRTAAVRAAPPGD
jgi:DNA-binding CsgD family transcriptional regulator